jgi:RIO kinase 1
LIHGDLSEYNILYEGGELYFIDVSQSIEHNHLNAFNFLKRDIINVNRYFKHVKCLVLRPKDVSLYFPEIFTTLI